MQSKKIIAVVGATGNQGSSVANTFLTLPAWHVRCLTRNPLSDTAKSLQNRGAEVVQADLNDPASLSRAFQGAHAIFVNTDFWAFWRPAVKAGTPAETATKDAFEAETKHGKNAVDAAAKVPTLERLIYSTLPPLKKASGGKYWRSGHWEAKAWTAEFIEQSHPALFSKTSFILVGAYNTNPMLNPKWDAASGKYVFAVPLSASTVMPIIDIQGSTGAFVRCLIEDEVPGTKLLAYDTDSKPNMGELVKIWSHASGREAVHVKMSIEDMLKIGMTYEHLDAAGYYDEYGYKHGIEGLIEPSQLKHEPKTKSYEQWLSEKNWDEVLEV